MPLLKGGEGNIFPWFFMKEDESAYFEGQVNILENQLDQIKKRLEELKKQKKEIK
jgi:hypothetical protein